MQEQIPWNGYFEGVLDLANSKTEAEEKVAQWEQGAREHAPAEVRAAGWTHPDGREVYLIRTNSRELWRSLPRPRVIPQELGREVEAAARRGERFERRAWRNRPALVSKDGTVHQEYEPGTEYDAEQWDLVPDAWDHEHCAICGTHICDHPDHACQEGFVTADEEWVCPPCWRQWIKGWEPIPSTHPG